MCHRVTPPSQGTFSSWKNGPGRTSQGSTEEMGPVQQRLTRVYAGQWFTWGF